MIAANLIDAVENNETSISEAKTQLEELLRTSNGARGFFVSFLTGHSKLSQNVPPEFLDEFKVHADLVYDLLIKNVVMSASTGYANLLAGEADTARKSLAVSEKTMAIIKGLRDPAMVKIIDLMIESIDILLNGAKDAESMYCQFLRRWGYDKAQLDFAKTTILSALAQDSKI
jgi:hypothetical protein